MKCIFCHKDSTTSKSVEHIIPESLGNKEQILPQGYVCDDCNHYFAIKIEKELLEQPYFISMRSRNEIKTKKDRLVKQKMIFPDIHDFSEIATNTTDNGKLIYIDSDNVFNNIINGKTYKMIELIYPEPEYPSIVMARFLAKCAMEYILSMIEENERIDFVDSSLSTNQFDPIRLFARYGTGKWAYSQRRVYNEGSLFIDARTNKIFETLHEMTIFFRDFQKLDNNKCSAEIYFAVIIMGIEYVICMSDPDISGYTKQWLKENENKSPLERSYEHIINNGFEGIRPRFIK